MREHEDKYLMKEGGIYSTFFFCSPLQLIFEIYLELVILIVSIDLSALLTFLK